MRVKFWGVRGSIPSPLTPSQIESKIAAVVQRIQAKDIKNQDSREKFLASLPKWLFGTIGANTSCVEVETAKGHHIIFDAGTGIRELGIDLTKRPDYGKIIFIIFLFLISIGTIYKDFLFLIRLTIREALLLCTAHVKIVKNSWKNK